MNTTELDDLQAGKAGEYLVCADIIMSGHIAFLSEQGLPFDVVMDVHGTLLKIQVKTTKSQRTLVDPNRAIQRVGYLFNIKRMGKNGRKIYKNSDVDVFALVALDSKEIGYILPADVKRTMVFRAQANKGSYHNELLTGRINEFKAAHKSGKTFIAIGKEFGVCASWVAKTIKDNKHSPGKSGTYLSDLTLNMLLMKIGLV